MRRHRPAPRRLPRRLLAALLGLLLAAAAWLGDRLLPWRGADDPAPTEQAATAPRDPGWTEPAPTLDPTPTPLFACRAVDGDTLHCDRLRVRLRGVDAPERGEPRHREAGRALQAMVEACTVRLVLIPRHRSHDRIVGDVLCGARNIGREMDAAGWSKPVGARR